jgi:hypothetical protein
VSDIRSIAASATTAGIAPAAAPLGLLAILLLTSP